MHIKIVEIVYQDVLSVMSLNATQFTVFYVSSIRQLVTRILGNCVCSRVKHINRKTQIKHCEILNMKRWLSVNLQSDFEADMEEFLKVNFQKEEKVCLFIIYTATLHLKTDSLAWYNFYTHTHTHHPILIFKQIRVE